MSKVNFLIEKKPANLGDKTKNDITFILDSFKKLKADETIKFPVAEGQTKSMYQKGIYICKKSKKLLGIEGRVCVQNGFMYLFKK